MKILIDTNIWLRFLLQDLPLQYKDCVSLISTFKHGVIMPYTSPFVLLEIEYILQKIYKIPVTNIKNDLENILKIKNLKILEKADTLKGWNYHKNHKIKFADCLIAAQLSKDIHLCTYDQEFKKIKNLKTYTPAQILELTS